MAKRSPKATFGLVAIALIAGAIFALYLLTGWDLFWMYLAAVNLVTFLAYGFDKGQARAGGGRVPEMILHLVVLGGGFIGGWLGRALYHHKTRKPLFTWVLVISTVLWLVILYFYLSGEVV